jgi:hypothetical protein
MKYKQDVDSGRMRDLCAKRIVLLMCRGMSCIVRKVQVGGSDKKFFVTFVFVTSRATTCARGTHRVDIFGVL